MGCDAVGHELGQAGKHLLLLGGLHADEGFLHRKGGADFSLVDVIEGFGIRGGYDRPDVFHNLFHGIL